MPAHRLAVEIDVRHARRALEADEEPLAAQGFIGLDGFAIPARTAVVAVPALHVLATAVGGIARVPRVGQVHRFPIAGIGGGARIAFEKRPTPGRMTFPRRDATGAEQHGSRDDEDGFQGHELK